MRLLLIWAQIHPAIGDPDKPGRIQVGAGQAVDAENFDVSRRWDPDTDLDRDALDAAMAVDPPTSVDDLFALLASQLQAQLGYHVAVQAIRPRPVPDAEPSLEP